MADVMPIGKYKNQPITALAQDRSYCEWLLAQGWFAERYPDIHTIIINNFGEPSETPEHNALQLRFLEEELRLQVSILALLAQHPYQSHFKPGQYAVFLQACTSPQFEVQGIDVSWIVSVWLPMCTSDSRGYNWEYSWYTASIRLAVECKSTLGDDYPAVLRFMHSMKQVELRVVVAEFLQFQGGTIAQVQALFQSSGVLLLPMQGIEALPPVHLWTRTDLPRAEAYCS